ncbi:MAG: hypothetical protein LBT46_06370 [Planctomycetaceae bacterium]|jgi:hypothetical protein|nr:hypothetical protein [Planctomycetaceae bacterium]
MKKQTPLIDFGETAADNFRKTLSDRRMALMPDEERERKGSFFTPQIWAEKSQEYLAQTFGENWQDEYYIWDCCCGTGNLLAGLVNPYNVWASTIDQADIDILHTSIRNRKCNLLEPHVFPFDFLNGNFNDLPEGLRNIIDDTEKQKRLIIYINPPYGECGRSKGKGESNKAGITKESKIYEELRKEIGKAARELFAFFAARIRRDIPAAKLGMFSKLKYLNSPNFVKFRKFFRAEFRKGFMVLASTFDNVTGQFPIGFLTWNLERSKSVPFFKCDVFDTRGLLTASKKFFPIDKRQLLNDWIDTIPQTGQSIGALSCKLSDFQNNQMVYIGNSKEQLPVGCKCFEITKDNLPAASVYLAVRHIIPHTWVNDRDQFLYPADSYKKDKRFQNDCLIFTLFHSQNRIKSKDGINHWIPFSAKESKAKDNFHSSFMSDVIKKRGRFSKKATAVLEAGKALWAYYHETIRKLRTPPVDASLYEIREYFKERNEQGRMNTKSADDKFNVLDKTLRDAVKALAKQIEPKVYEYGFLLQ